MTNANPVAANSFSMGNKPPISAIRLLTEIFHLYNTFIRNAFLSMLAYRMRYYTGILTYLLFVSVHYFVWQAVFSGSPPGTKIAGFTLEEMVTYVVIGWISRSLYFSTIDEDINELVKTGQVSVILLRPVNFHLMMLAQAFGESLFRLLFFTAPIAAVVLYAFPVFPPASFLNLILFLIGTLFSFFILAEINFLIGLLAFSLASIQGVMRAKYYLTQLFSGLLIPITMFPSWFAPVVNILPFKMITFVPLMFYLGKADGIHNLYLLLEMVGWAIVLAILCHWSWKRAVARLTVHGG